MYKLLIIDDEEPVREAISLLGDWNGLGIAETYEAAGGIEALSLLERQSVDIALVDMKMPEMSGSELLQRLEDEYPNLLTIVISGYDDFEFTRQAIRSKVVDYLLKPINRRELNAALRKATDVLRARKLREDEFISRNIALNLSLPKLKEKIYGSIIERSFHYRTNEAFLSLIGADLDEYRYAAAAVRLLNEDRIREERFRGDAELLHFAAANVLNETAGGTFQAFSFVHPRREREMAVILTVRGGYEEDIAYHAYHKLVKAVAALRELFGIVAAAGVGRVYPAIDGLADSYEAAGALVDGLDLLAMKDEPAVTADKGGGAVSAAPKRQESAERETAPVGSRIRGLRSALESGNAALAASVADELLESWSAAGRFTLGESQRNLAELIVWLNDIALELGVPAEELPAGRDYPFRFIGLRADYASFAQYGRLVKDIASYYAERIRRTQALNQSFRIGDIKDYIDNHYFEDIKISMFADKYFLSREYLMKLFKSEYGCGIHEYVQQVRMGKAKHLLRHPELKIQDISEMLGYKDKNYFSKAFRNYCGLSPSEYRALQEEGGEK